MLSGWFAAALLAGWLLQDGSSEPGPAPIPENGVGSEVPATPVPKDLLSIARREAERIRQQHEQQARHDLSRLAQTSRPASAQIAGVMERLVQLGPDIVPILDKLLGEFGKLDGAGRKAAFTAIALATLHRRTQSEAALRVLAQTSVKAEPDLARTILQSVEGIDHPLVLQMAQPRLTDADPKVVSAAVTAMSYLSDPSVAQLLRPLLTKDTVVLRALVPALERLRDTTSAPMVAQLPHAQDDPKLVASVIRFVRELGGCSAMRVLHGLAAERIIQDYQIYSTFQAIQQVGLRHHEDCGAEAESLLLKGMNDPDVLGLQRRRIADLLGPFQNDVAYEFRSGFYRERLRSKGGDIDSLLGLIGVQLNFKRWDEALKSSKRARGEDDRKRYTAEIATYRAVAYAGLGRFDRADRELRAVATHPADLAEKWPSLQKMAMEPAFAELFVREE